MTRRKRLVGVAALSAVALATSLGAVASADEVCINCTVQPPSLVVPGRAEAFSKIENRGNAADAFYKFRSGNSFHKFEHGPFHKD